MLFVAMQRKEASADFAVQEELAEARAACRQRDENALFAVSPEAWLGFDARTLQTRLQGAPPVKVAEGLLRLCDYSLLLAHRDPQLALVAARTAVAYARAAKHARASKHLLADLRAEAWATLANVHRVLDDFKAADAAWQRVDALLPRGSGDPVLAGEVAERKASHWRGIRRFSRARHCLRLAASVYRQSGDHQRLGRVRLAEASVHFYELDTRKALRAVVAAFDLIDPAADPALTAWCLHLFALCLADGGEAEYALEWIDLLDHGYAEEGGSLAIRSSWLRGRLYARLGNWHAAERHLDAVRREFLARGQDYDAALAGVDLAVAYCEQGQLSAVRLLASEMYPVFLSKDIPREASAALILFARAAREERLEVEKLVALALELEPIRRRHGR